MARAKTALKTIGNATDASARRFGKLPGQIPVTDQWAGLLLRSQAEHRIFFVPASVLSVFEIRDGDQGLKMEDLQIVLGNVSRSIKNLGVENAILVNNLDSPSIAGMRIVDIIKNLDIGPYESLWPSKAKPGSSKTPKSPPKRRKARDRNSATPGKKAKTS